MNQMATSQSLSEFLLEILHLPDAQAQRQVISYMNDHYQMDCQFQLASKENAAMFESPLFAQLVNMPTLRVLHHGGRSYGAFWGTFASPPSDPDALLKEVAQQLTLFLYAREQRQEILHLQHLLAERKNSKVLFQELCRRNALTERELLSLGEEYEWNLLHPHTFLIIKGVSGQEISSVQEQSAHIVEALRAHGMFYTRGSYTAGIIDLTSIAMTRLLMLVSELCQRSSRPEQGLTFLAGVGRTTSLQETSYQTSAMYAAAALLYLEHQDAQTWTTNVMSEGQLWSDALSIYNKVQFIHTKFLACITEIKEAEEAHPDLLQYFRTYIHNNGNALRTLQDISLTGLVRKKSQATLNRRLDVIRSICVKHQVDLDTSLTSLQLALNKIEMQDAHMKYPDDILCELFDMQSMELTFR